MKDGLTLLERWVIRRIVKRRTLERQTADLQMDLDRWCARAEALKARQQEITVDLRPGWEQTAAMISRIEERLR